MNKIMSLQVDQMVPRVRLAYNSPADVLRSDVVSVPSEATDHADEFLSISIVLIYRPTVGASPTCVHWVYEFERNPSEFRLVFDEPSELIESPRMLGATLSLPNRYPITDAHEILKDNPAFGVFGFRNQPLGYGVIDVSGEPRFLTTSFLEQSLGGFGVLLLEFRPQPCVSMSQTIELASRIQYSIRVSSYVLDSKIHADPVFGLEWDWLWSVYGSGEVEGSVSEKEISLSSYSIHSPFLVFSDDYRNLDSTLKGEKRGVVQALPRQYPIVVDHSTVVFENGFDGFVPLVGFHDLADGPDGHLCAEAEPLSDSVVENVMEGYLVSKTLLESHSSDVVAGLVESFHHLLQLTKLLVVWNKLDQERLLQVGIDDCPLYLRVVVRK